MFEPLLSSALTQISARPQNGLHACCLTESVEYAFLDVRGQATDPAFTSTLIKATGLTPPVSPNTFNQQDNHFLFWMGPDQWLLALPFMEKGKVELEMHSAAHGKSLTLTDVSSGYTLLSLSGDQADELVRSATPFDVAQLNPGVSTQTIFAKAHVMMWKPHTTEYRILVRRSFADYLCRWLIAAGAEFKEVTHG